MARLSLRVDGLRCAGCADALTAALRTAPGVRNVEIGPDAAIVHIEFDAAATTPATLAGIVREEGYGAALAG